MCVRLLRVTFCYHRGLACYGPEWLPYYAPFIERYQDVLLTVSHHFYPESHNAANSSVPKLYKFMSTGDATEESAQIASTVAEVNSKYPKAPFVIGEGNSVSGHGQLNVSTTFGACLWAVEETMHDRWTPAISPTRSSKCSLSNSSNTEARERRSGWSFSTRTTTPPLQPPSASH